MKASTGGIMANQNANQKPGGINQSSQRPQNTPAESNKFGNKNPEQQPKPSTSEKGSSNTRGSRPSGAV